MGLSDEERWRLQELEELYAEDPVLAGTGTDHYLNKGDSPSRPAVPAGSRIGSGHRKLCIPGPRVHDAAAPERGGETPAAAGRGNIQTGVWP